MACIGFLILTYRRQFNRRMSLCHCMETRDPTRRWRLRTSPIAALAERSPWQNSTWKPTYHMSFATSESCRASRVGQVAKGKTSSRKVHWLHYSNTATTRRMIETYSPLQLNPQPYPWATHIRTRQCGQRHNSVLRKPIMLGVHGNRRS